MENIELDIKAEKLWHDLSHDNRIELLSNYRFWEGFSYYLYDYIPEDLKAILRRKIEDNDPQRA